MRRGLLIVLVGSALVVDGVVYGRWTDRWSFSRDSELAAAKVQEVPMRFGDWEGRANEPLGPREIELAGFQGHINRTYTDRRTGSIVHVLLACGRPGPLAVHTPEVCYCGLGYQAIGTAKHLEKLSGDRPPAEFWKARFGKSDSAVQSQLRIYWTWSANGVWRAPENARIAFAGAPVLYKLYVIQEITRDESQMDKAGQEFLGQFLPILDQTLFREVPTEH